MEFSHRYHGESHVESSSQSTEMHFSPDTLRNPTYFTGKVDQHIPFREAISALHDVVVSDLRFVPKEREVYQAWLKEQESAMLAEFMGQREELKEEAQRLQIELSALRQEGADILAPYFNARGKYFKYLLKTDYDAWMVLDPVITVHPDEIFFECFSLDESSYGRLSCSHNVFKEINESACGTTNIDYSAGLYNEFQKIRTYKETQLNIDPGGFEVATSQEDAFIENKIDLPESWVRGFLQVSAAMNLPLKKIQLSPMDIYNFCFILARRKEKAGPRAMRFVLKPGEPIEVIFEPWETVLNCPRSVYLGEEPDEIRIWGRRRLRILERLIPIADRFEMYLLGTGLPCFIIAHMPDMTFTLGLSGWTANDWSRLGNFDLMAPRADVDDITKSKVFEALKENWFESPDSLAKRLNLDPDLVLSALSIYTQAGRVIYDLDKQVFRVRELSQDPLPMESLRFHNEREEKANLFVEANLVTLMEPHYEQKRVKLKGQVLDNAVEYHSQIVIDHDQRLIGGTCTCHFYVYNKMYKGPCEHMLGLRMFYNKTNGKKD